MLVHVVADYGASGDLAFAEVAQRLMAQVPDATVVVGPNAGHSLAFVAGEVELHYLDVPAAGSQFRSRDFLPAALGRLARGDRSAVREPVSSDLVPDVPSDVVAYTDG